MGSEPEPDPDPGPAAEREATQGPAVLERPGPSLGVLLAGVALVAAALEWPPATVTVAGIAVVPAGLAGVALVVFVARRHGVADRETGTAVAGVASVALVVYATYALAVVLAAPEPRPPLGPGTPLAAFGGLGGIVAAVLDRRGVRPDRVRRAGQTFVMAMAVGLGGFAAIVVWQLAVATLLSPVLGPPSELSTAQQTLISTGALGLGTGTTALAYLRWSDRGFAFLDVDVPSLSDVGYAVGGVVALFAILYGMQYLYAAVGIENAQHGITEAAKGTPAILLVLIPASWLVVGPGEELLFRNVVQKSLYDDFPRPAAVVAASVVFAAVHFTAYWGGTVLSTLASLSLVFVLSLVLGGLYARTDNVVVPALVHGTFNAVQFIALYLSL